MAFTLFLRKTCSGSVLTNVASKLLTAQTVNSSLVGTSIGTKYFNTLNRSTDGQKTLLSNLNQPVVLQNKYIHHGHIWAMEKYVSWALLAIIPAGLYCPCHMMDNFVAIAVVTHMHWGVEAILCDYLRPSLVGHTISNLVAMGVYLISAITLAGLLYFNHNDIGFIKAVQDFWFFGIKPRYVPPTKKDCRCAPGDRKNRGKEVTKA